MESDQLKLTQMTKQAAEVAQVDTKAILKYVVDEDAMSKFEKFVQGYLGIHHRFEFHMMYNFGEQVPIAAGFVEDAARVYVLVSDALMILDVDKDAGKVSVGVEYKREGLVCADKHPTQNSVFVLATKSEIILLDVMDLENPSVLPIESVVAAKFVAGGDRIACLTSDGILHVVSLSEGNVGDLRLFDEEPCDNLRMCVHYSEKCLFVVNGVKIAFVELSEPPKLKVMNVQREPITAEFLPEDSYGVALAFANGVMCFYSFDSSRPVVEQKLGKSDISCIAFCPGRSDILAAAAGRVVSFAGIPQWGFGAFNVYSKYEQHLSDITNLSWGSDDNGLSLVTTDKSGVLHVFEVPQEYLQLY